MNRRNDERSERRFQTRRLASLVAHFIVGALLGVLLLHPVAMTITWLELRMEHSLQAINLGKFLLSRLTATFSGGMLEMTFLYAAIGGSIGLLFHALERTLEKREQTINRLRREIAEDIPSLISTGEGDRVEFKSTARWDLRQERVNKELEIAIAKTIAGFANGAGGSLLVGVSDEGSLVGMGKDYQTLKRKDRDGFEQFLMTLVTTHLGGDICPRVHVVFAEIEGKDVCRIMVERGHRPVYLRDGNQARYYVRTGNITRELDVEEAVRHIEWRWGRRSGIVGRKNSRRLRT
jgi:hypothetical protein